MSWLNYDVIKVTDMNDDIVNILYQLKKMSTKVMNDVCKGAVEKAAPVLLAEQKRLLENAPNYPNFPKLNSGWLWMKVAKNKHGRWIARCGYRDGTVKNNVEVLILEFGRPSGRSKKGSGKRRTLAVKDYYEYKGKMTNKIVRIGGIDKKGRKIGVIQPYPIIRGAWFNKRFEIKKILRDYVLAEIEKLWTSMTSSSI